MKESKNISEEADVMKAVMKYLLLSFPALTIEGPTFTPI